MSNIFYTDITAISVIFKLSFEPKEEHFYELTAEQYEEAWRQGHDENESLYLILSPQMQNIPGELNVVTDSERLGLLNAVKVIERYCQESGQSFKDDDYKSKLRFVSNLLPPVFTENTVFKQGHLKRVK